MQCMWRLHIIACCSANDIVTSMPNEWITNTNTNVQLPGFWPLELLVCPIVTSVSPCRMSSATMRGFIIEQYSFRKWYSASFIHWIWSTSSVIDGHFYDPGVMEWAPPCYCGDSRLSITDLFQTLWWDGGAVGLVHSAKKSSCSTTIHNRFCISWQPFISCSFEIRLSVLAAHLWWGGSAYSL